MILEPAVFGAELGDGCVSVPTADFGAFTRALPRIARDSAVSLFEVAPADGDLDDRRDGAHRRTR